MEETSKTKTKAQKPKYSIGQNICFMLGFAWREYKLVLVYITITVVLSVGIKLAELFVVPSILQRVESAAPLSELLKTILFFTGILIAMSAVVQFCESTGQPGRIKIRMGVVDRIIQKRMTMSFPYTEDSETIKMMEKVEESLGNNREAVENIWLTLTELLKNLLGFALYLILLSSLDPIMLVVVLITAAIGYFVKKHCNEKVYVRRKLDEECANGMWYISSQGKNNGIAKDLRIFGMRDWLEDLYAGIRRTYQSMVNKNEREYLVGDLVDVGMTFLRNGVAYFYLISKTIAEGLPASEFLLYFTAVSGFTAWLTGILSIMTQLHKESLTICTVRELLDLPDLFQAKEEEAIPSEENGYRIELRNVSFRYPGAEKNTLENINLTIGAGEKLAVVGLNGAGKTTLIKLICGFYNPTEGEILLNGVDIRKLNRREYYKLFSAVFQKVFSVAATLAQNVAQQTEGIDMDRLKGCIEKAGLTEKVESLPKGYDTQISQEVYLDGILLSGGEMQRLMLARALYKNGSIIVLDEPTAALDPIAENDMYLKYNEMTAGRTSVYISHRLASTRFCDRIIFLAEGKIQEIGTHDELMEQGGRYAELFRVQSKYYGKEAVIDENGEEI